ncbi:DUF1513 domain-containing protein [Pukyongiella litopenaei]|uniref:DUF1513 domain-containing protein n=1 Tax=Pukyongiella litopenaei TaxID=2605946 RepID=A0A2S0MUC8_9RHOB|nr:DUF1513 domain-containing protein [Pukyongiella litopenaei]AVO39499.1 DUF1513 domain-containing protein [Pukyongiella litopenaei]
MTHRRGFLAGLLAAGLVPRSGWAEAGSPAYLSAARSAGGDYVLVGLSETLDEVFRLPMPSRGHAAAAHPARPQAVAFARRPGMFALVIDCRTGQVAHQLTAPGGRHFYGHGVFSPDGTRLFTTENDHENARGVVGVWDVAAGYARMAEFGSGGVGPHDIALLPDGETLVLANGGIETHPDSGRAKLNIPTMAPNLSYLDFNGNLLDLAEPDRPLRRNSIRHLSVRRDGQVAFAMQWQDDTHDGVPLGGLHRRGGALSLFRAETGLWRDMQGYAGSIAFSRAGDRVALTSPRGNLFATFDARSLNLLEILRRSDVCGVAEARSGFATTGGDGSVALTGQPVRQVPGLAFDNHLVRVREF